MPDPTWGYSAVTPDTPESEVSMIGGLRCWSRLFADGVIPAGWHDSPASIPAPAPPPPAPAPDAPPAKGAK